MTKRKYRVCGYDGNGHPIYVGRGIKAQVRKPRIPRKFYQPIKLPLEFKPILILPDLNIEELLKKIQTK